MLVCGCYGYPMLSCDLWDRQGQYWRDDSDEENDDYDIICKNGANKNINNSNSDNNNNDNSGSTNNEKYQGSGPNKHAARPRSKRRAVGARYSIRAESVRHAGVGPLMLYASRSMLDALSSVCWETLVACRCWDRFAQDAPWYSARSIAGTKKSQVAGDTSGWFPTRLAIDGTVTQTKLLLKEWIGKHRKRDAGDPSFSFDAVLWMPRYSRPMTPNSEQRPKKRLHQDPANVHPFEGKVTDRRTGDFDSLVLQTSVSSTDRDQYRHDDDERARHSKLLSFYCKAHPYLGLTCIGQQCAATAAISIKATVTPAPATPPPGDVSPLCFVPASRGVFSNVTTLEVRNLSDMTDMLRGDVAYTDESRIESSGPLSNVKHVRVGTQANFSNYRCEITDDGAGRVYLSGHGCVDGVPWLQCMMERMPYLKTALLTTIPAFYDPMSAKWASLPETRNGRTGEPNARQQTSSGLAAMTETKAENRTDTESPSLLPSLPLAPQPLSTAATAATTTAMTVAEKLMRSASQQAPLPWPRNRVYHSHLRVLSLVGYQTGLSSPVIGSTLESAYLEISGLAMLDKLQVSLGFTASLVGEWPPNLRLLEVCDDAKHASEIRHPGMPMDDYNDDGIYYDSDDEDDDGYDDDTHKEGNDYGDNNSNDGGITNENDYDYDYDNSNGNAGGNGIKRRFKNVRSKGDSGTRMGGGNRGSDTRTTIDINDINDGIGNCKENDNSADTRGGTEAVSEKNRKRKWRSNARSHVRNMHWLNKAVQQRTTAHPNQKKWFARMSRSAPDSLEEIIVRSYDGMIPLVLPSGSGVRRLTLQNFCVRSLKPAPTNPTAGPVVNDGDNGGAGATNGNANNANHGNNNNNIGNHANNGDASRSDNFRGVDRPTMDPTATTYLPFRASHRWPSLRHLNIEGVVSVQSRQWLPKDLFVPTLRTIRLGGFEATFGHENLANVWLGKLETLAVSGSAASFDIDYDAMHSATRRLGSPRYPYKMLFGFIDAPRLKQLDLLECEGIEAWGKKYVPALNRVHGRSPLPAATPSAATTLFDAWKDQYHHHHTNVGAFVCPLDDFYSIHGVPLGANGYAKNNSGDSNRTTTTVASASDSFGTNLNTNANANVNTNTNVNASTSTNAITSTSADIDSNTDTNININADLDIDVEQTSRIFAPRPAPLLPAPTPLQQLSSFYSTTTPSPSLLPSLSPLWLPQYRFPFASGHGHVAGDPVGYAPYELPDGIQRLRLGYSTRHKDDDRIESDACSDGDDGNKDGDRNENETAQPFSRTRLLSAYALSSSSLPLPPPPPPLPPASSLPSSLLSPPLATSSQLSFAPSIPPLPQNESASMWFPHPFCIAGELSHATSYLTKLSEVVLSADVSQLVGFNSSKHLDYADPALAWWRELVAFALVRSGHPYTADAMALVSWSALLPASVNRLVLVQPTSFIRTHQRVSLTIAIALARAAAGFLNPSFEVVYERPSRQSIASNEFGDRDPTGMTRDELLCRKHR